MDIGGSLGAIRRMKPTATNRKGGSEVKTRNVFVSHSWKHGEHYDRMVGLLRRRPTVESPRRTG